MKTGFIAPVVIAAIGAYAHADPALPAAMKAKLEAIAPLQAPIIYVPANPNGPERWVAFVGQDGAMAGFLVTPGAGPHELSRISEWPVGVRVVGAYQSLPPAHMPGNFDEQHVWLVVESLAVPELAQPAGLRGVLPVNIPEPQYVSSAMAYAENLVPFMGTADASELPRRLAAANAYWDEDTADQAIGDDAKRAKLFARATRSKPAAQKLVPAEGIAVIESWQNLFARERGRVHVLDKSRDALAVKRLVATNPSCQGKACGGLLLGAANGKLVIRALLAAPDAAPAVRGARHAVTAIATDTQTAATARVVGLDGAFRVEAPLQPGGTGHGTFGLVDTTVVQRDGAFVATEATNVDPAASPAFRFADLDGDGYTDVLAFDTHPHFAFGGALHDTGLLEAGYELAVSGLTTIDDMIAAALAIPDERVTAKQACALLKTAKTAKGLARALAPNGTVYVFFEPFHPGAGDMKAYPVTDGAAELKDSRTCELTCDDKLPFCAEWEQGPGSDFYVFARVHGKLKLVRAALYRGG